MAFLLSRSNAFARHLRSHPQQMMEGALALSRRGFHVAPGAREKALLASDPALSRFKSHKKSVKSLRKFFDLLTVVVVAGGCYEIYVKATTREEARSKAGDA